MSVKIMGGVWELELDPPKKLVLLAMADHADHDGKKVHPSVDLVAWKTGYSARQVQRIIHELIDAGILEVQELGTGRGKPTHYHVVLEKGVKLSPIRPKEGCQDVTFSAEKGRQDVTFSDPPKGRHPDAAILGKARQDVTLSAPKARQDVTHLALKGDIHDSERVTSGERKGDIAMSPEPSLTEPSLRTVKGEYPPSPPDPGNPAPVVGSKPPVPKPRATRIAEDFAISDAERQFAEQLGLSSAEIDAETAKFRDHFRGTGGTKVDWVATWRNWMRRAVEGRAARPNPRAVSAAVKPPSKADETRAWAAKLRAEGR